MEHRILSIRDPDSIMLTQPYLDSYISSHYRQFLSLYHNYSLDEETLVLCRKHLDILIDFAAQKNEAVRQKFYQLKVMDFMTREINLEYEVKIIRQNYIDSIKKQKEEEEKARLAEEKKQHEINNPPKVKSPKGSKKSKLPRLNGGDSKKPFKLDLSNVPRKGLPALIVNAEDSENTSEDTSNESESDRGTSSGKSESTGSSSYSGSGSETESSSESPKQPPPGSKKPRLPLQLPDHLIKGPPNPLGKSADPSVVPAANNKIIPTILKAPLLAINKIEPKGVVEPLPVQPNDKIAVPQPASITLLFL